MKKMQTMIMKKKMRKFKKEEIDSGFILKSFFKLVELQLLSQLLRTLASIVEYSIKWFLKKIPCKKLLIIKKMHKSWSFKQFWNKRDKNWTILGSGWIFKKLMVINKKSYQFFILQIKHRKNRENTKKIQ